MEKGNEISMQGKLDSEKVNDTSILRSKLAMKIRPKTKGAVSLNMFQLTESVSR